MFDHILYKSESKTEIFSSHCSEYECCWNKVSKVGYFEICYIHLHVLSKRFYKIEIPAFLYLVSRCVLMNLVLCVWQLALTDLYSRSCAATFNTVRIMQNVSKFLSGMIGDLQDVKEVQLT